MPHSSPTPDSACSSLDHLEAEASKKPRPAAPPALDAIKVARLPAPGNKDVTYVVLTQAPAGKADKRAERRWRTHLRSGKIVDAQTCIVTESQTRDRSARGARLRLAANVVLPRRIRFFDDVTKHMFEATVAWQRGREIGVTFLREIDLLRLTRAELFRLGIRMPRADH